MNVDSLQDGATVATHSGDLVNGALVELAVEISDCLTNGDWRLSHVIFGALGELPHWRLRMVNVTLGDLGELGELPYWRFAKVTPRCFVAGAQ